MNKLELYMIRTVRKNSAYEAVFSVDGDTTHEVFKEMWHSTIKEVRDAVAELDLSIYGIRWVLKDKLKSFDKTIFKGELYLKSSDCTQSKKNAWWRAYNREIERINDVINTRNVTTKHILHSIKIKRAGIKADQDDLRENRKSLKEAQKNLKNTERLIK